MIYLILRKNGMGNQMFVYAYTRYLQEIYSKRDGQETVTVNPYRFSDTSADKFIDERHLSLQHFRLNGNVVFLEADKQQECSQNYLRRDREAIGLVNRMRRKLFHVSLSGEKYFMQRAKKGVYECGGNSEEAKAYYRTVMSDAKDKYVFGHFQDRRYFDSIRDILKDEFEIVTPPSPENAEFLQKIRGTNAVCLHIRRGDYLKPHWAKLNICDETYYQNAVDYICRHTENPVFYIFSNTHDDLMWIKENYHLKNSADGAPVNAEYVDLSNPDYEELRLMRACRHFIIPNSTFSWWAAYLAQAEGAIVCAPDRWDLTLEGDSGMNCPEWSVIKTGK